MKRQMEKMQKELSKREIVIARQGVTVKILGSLEIRDLTIEADAFRDGDMKAISSAVKEAVNVAIHDAQDMMKKELATITGGMNIPGLT